MCIRDSVQPVVVGHGQRRQAQAGGLIRQLLGLAGTVQEAERRVRMQLGVSGLGVLSHTAPPAARRRPAAPAAPPDRRPAPPAGTPGGCRRLPTIAAPPATDRPNRSPPPHVPGRPAAATTPPPAPR